MGRDFFNDLIILIVPYADRERDRISIVDLGVLVGSGSGLDIKVSQNWTFIAVFIDLSDIALKYLYIILTFMSKEKLIILDKN